MKNKNKNKNKLKDDNSIKKKLTKSQKKKLQKVLERRRKKANINDLLGELKKHQLTDEQYSKLTPRFGSKSKGFKQEINESAGKIYSSSKKNKSQQNESITSVNCSTASFKVLDLELSSSDEEDNELNDNEINNNLDNKIDSDLIANEVESFKEDVITIKTNKKRKFDDSDTKDEQTTNQLIKPSTVDSKFVQLNRSQEITASRNKLPIIAEESNIIDEIKNNPVVIICGETGSGKTTQLPQFLYEHGFAENKKIVITQPRRVAAISMSKRVAYEMNLGEDIVSYQIRNEGNVTERTKIKFLTDGVLMKELQKDILLSNYSIVIIDEAHERSIYSDILIGLISRIIKLREQRGEFFRLIIMSATLRVTDFTENKKLFKIPPPIINIQTRQFPIQIHFNKNTPDDYIKDAYKKVCKIHKEQSLNGGILVFVTGRKEVLQLVNKLKQTFPFVNNSINDEKKIDSKIENKLNDGNKEKIDKPTSTKLKDLIPEINLDNLTAKPTNKSFIEELSDSDITDSENDDEENDKLFEIEKSTCAQPLYCLPLYSMLPEKEQAKVFEQPPENSRLCVIATNVAETSLTIPNIKYVIDTGKLKNKFYDKTTGIYTHLIEWCAKSSADQRAGRSGRSGPGICYRLYSSAVYNNDFKEYPDAEILKKPLDDLVLQLKSMYIDKIQNFPFPTIPDLNNIETTEKRLMMLGALKRQITDKKTESILITSLGKVISVFPVSPRYGKMLSIAIQQDLLDYAIAIVSLLTIQEIFIYPDQQDREEEEKDEELIKLKKTNETFNLIKKKWLLNSKLNLGDILLMLKVCFASELNDNKLTYCKANNLRHKAMIEIHKLRKLLIKEINLNFQGINLTTDLKQIKFPNDEQIKKLQQLMLICFCDHIAKRLTNEELSSSDKLKKLKNSYKSIELDDSVFLHDKTVLKEQQPEWVVYQEIFENKKLFMRNVVSIDSNWIPIYAKDQCKFSKPLENPEPFYDKLADQIKCYVIPTIGPSNWKLKQTPIEYPETNEKYKLFTQFLLEGKIFDYFTRYNKDNLYLSNPKVITKSWGRLKEEPTKLLNVLIENRISSKASLKKKFKLKPAFLLDEFKNCVLESKQYEIEQTWPPTD